MAQRISVAMATYNGAKYLDAQLRSLAEQHLLPDELVVCDDGSSDNTVDIVRSFSKHVSFEVSVHCNEKRLGFADNFLKAAALCRNDWISFCDQDDWWLPTKLENTSKAIDAMNSASIILQCAYISNESLEHSYRVFPGFVASGNYGANSQYGFWVWPGFLQTVRADLLRGVWGRVRPRSYYPGHDMMPHDKFTCLLANAVGGIVVQSEPAALYRRHSTAVTGDYAVQTLRQRLDKAISVGSDHYSFLAEVAAETAEYLRHLAGYSDPAKASSFRLSAVYFDKMSSIHRMRADLYSSNDLRAGLRQYACIARSGGYFGPPMISSGWKSAAKDLLRVAGLIGTPRTGPGL